MATFVLSAFSDEAAVSLAEQIEALREAGFRESKTGVFTPKC